MAYLGSIGVRSTAPGVIGGLNGLSGMSAIAAVKPPMSGSRTLQTWLNSNTWLTAATNASYSGVTKAGGVILPYVRLALIHRVSCTVVMHAKSDINGQFSFGPLDASVTDYTIVAFDPSVTISYNDRIVSRATPV